MKIISKSIPKTTKLFDKQFLFGADWLLTVFDVDNLKEIVVWCHENYSDNIIKYYRHCYYGEHPHNVSHSIEEMNSWDSNHPKDYLTIRLKDDIDMMAFKLRWL